MKKLALATAFLFASSMFVMAQSTASPSSTDQQQQPSATSPSSTEQQPSATSPSTEQQPSATSPSSSQSSTGSEQSESSQSSMGASNANQETIQGCLSQGANGYTLAASSGTTYNLTGDTSKLASHVGEEVQVKGSAASGSGAANASSTGAENASPNSAASTSSNSTNQNFEVKKVKRISKSCSTTGSSASPSAQ